MPRKPFIPTQDPYHVSTRCINKDWFASPLSEVWQIMSENLTKTQLIYNIRIHSFVLMGNHFHMIIDTPEMNLSAAMNYFLRECSKAILKSSSRINCTFAPRFFRSRLKDQQRYLKAYKYIYRNPVEAGISSQAEAYPWSTLHQLLGQSKMTMPLSEDKVLFENVEKILKWINEEPDPIHKELVKKALRKDEFKLSRRACGYKHDFEALPY